MPMDNVLIVSKSSGGEGVFVGGVNLDNRTHVQLCPGHVGYTHSPETELTIGDVWELELGRIPETNTDLPHTENWNVMSRGSCTAKLSSTDIKHFILNSVGAPYVHPSTLFDGDIEFNHNGKGYIDVNGSIPSYSVGFWRFHIPLYLNYDNNQNEDGNYYMSESGDFHVKYTGIANPAPELPAGTVLRLFLSQSYESPWKDVFWLLLSGWFL